ncbi:Adenylate kinase [Phytophthora megakarya]|uniref:Adenylate kinase n=1 Tax=Phytophthora megakarya TaxID=4795 RepID=A0A225VZ05_9STRA|nr:Adenylate kinase [Phytophthora megakarya]
MRVFITDLGSSFSTELARNCQDAGLEVVGTAVRGGKSEMMTLKRQLQSHPGSDVAGAVKEPVALQTDATSWRRLVQQADVVVVTSLTADQKLAMEILKVFEKGKPSNGDDEANEDEGGETVKRFIAVSSVLSWSKNAPFAASGAGSSHVEDDFKSRRPARKYAELKTTETQILSAHRAGELETCVVGAGLIYGGAQSQLQLIFREAWLHPNRPLLVPSLATQAQPTSQGRNLLPMISLYDLALLVFRVAASPSPPPKKYLLAVDKVSGSTTLCDVCLGVSTLLASGHLRDREDSDKTTDAEADALLLDEEEELVTPLQLHLRFDTSAGAMHTLVAPEEWRHYSRGLLGNLAFFVDDFIQALDLRPLRTIVLGAPRAGKTLLGQKLAKDYYLPYLTPTTLLQELFAPENDVMTPPTASQPDPPSDEGQQEIDSDAVQTSKPVNEVLGATETQKLRVELQQWAPTAGSSENVTQLPQNALVALLRWKLRSAACRNQGYVLDGLPISAPQAEQIFVQEPIVDNVNEGGPSEEANGEENAGGEPATPAVDVEAMLASLKPRRQVEVPNRVIVLQAPRAMLEIRAQALSEAEAERSENTQEAFARRFDEFEGTIEALEAFFEKPRAHVDVTAVNGVEVLELTLRDEHGYRDESSFATPIQRYMEQGGRAPRNFHPTQAELREQHRVAEMQAREAEIRAAQLTREQDAQDEAAQQQKLARERARLELLHREETELLETRAKPLRTYLMDTVLPALTEGMLEVVKVQPTDPIDYLAEFLFRKGQELEANIKEA